MDGIEGLIHVSEMSLDEGQKAEEVYPPDSEVKVKVLSIDPEERKVSLSISATKEGSDSDPYTSYLNSSDGRGTLGDILGESLAAQKSDVDQPEEEAVLQESEGAAEVLSEDTSEEETEEEEVEVEVEVEAAAAEVEAEEEEVEVAAEEPATEEEPAEEVEEEEKTS
jgi:ribosomal protein S1